MGAERDPGPGTGAAPGEQPRRIEVPAPDDRVVIEDPERHRTWIVDAAFLRSRHRCIYGAGCQGIGTERAPELALGCCSVGAQFVDEDDVATVVRSFARLDPALMQHHAEARTDGFLRATDAGTTATRLVDGACIFLNRPGFAAGQGCALHLGALADGERPLDRKPNVCWQLPLRTTWTEDANGGRTVTLRRWTREDWGGPLAWWCTEPDTAPEAFTGERPVVLANRDELLEIVGSQVYERIRSALTVERGQSS